MIRTKKRRADVDISYYVVAFMDVLGQQEHLRALDELPDKKDAAQMESFVAALKQTYGVVTEMRDSFEKFFKSFSKRKLLFPESSSLVQSCRASLHLPIIRNFLCETQNYWLNTWSTQTT
jgi:hypothetical protein